MKNPPPTSGVFFMRKERHVVGDQATTTGSIDSQSDPIKPVLRVFSYGGGTQSTAALVLAAQGKIDFSTFVYSNVGEKSEPDTLAYVRSIAVPYATRWGIDVQEIRRTSRDGSDSIELYDRVMSDHFKGVQLPMRLSSGAPARRHCTVDYKIRVLAKWQREHGASAANPAIVGLGISWDEIQRMRKSTDDATTIVYPLIDLRLTRQDCEGIIRDAGLPQPGKSSCFYCPFKTQAEWQRMRHERPDRFAEALVMEAHMDAKMVAEGEGHCTFHSKGPLLAITSEARQIAMLFEFEDSCESGYCMT